MLARARGRHRLAGMQVVRRRDGNDVDVRRRQQIVVTSGDVCVREGDSVLGEVGARTILVARAQPRDGRVRVALKRRDMLRRAPADTSDGDAKLPVAGRHLRIQSI